MPTKLIVPGLNGSTEGHWQDYWLKDDPDAVLVRQRDWRRPVILDWVLQLEQALARYPGSIIIAHSIGAIVAASLSCRTSRHLVKGALLVAPCNLSRVANLHPGLLLETQALRMKTLPFPSMVVGSRNDPYMPIEEAEDLAKILGSEFTDLGHAGHINIASGYGRWRKGYRLAARLERHSYGDRAGGSAGFFSSLFGLELR